MIRYLDGVKCVWDRILTCGDTTLPYSTVDSTTVEKLESLCPKFCTAHRNRLLLLMQEGTIFPSVQDDDLRKALIFNLSNIPTLIPTLRTFFETVKYLEPL
jgi:hypothetical protein